MAWRLHLSDRPIRRIDMLPGKPSILAAWIGNDHISYLDLQTGASRGERTIDKIDTQDRKAPAWRPFLDALTASNGIFLPSVRIGTTTILTTQDGATRLMRMGGRELIYATGDTETALTIDESVKSWVSVDMDRALGVIVALDDVGKLHLFQNHLKIAVIDTKFMIEPEQRPDLAVVNSGGSIFATDGKQIALFDGKGVLKKRNDLYFTVGAMRASGDGKLLALTDMDANLIRIYDGETLTPTHQRFGVDLMADAKLAQLIPGSTSPNGAISALAINTRGVVAFSMGGAVCVTNLARFKTLPGIEPAIDEEDDTKTSIDSAASFFPDVAPKA